jgi:hypothetical protein
MSSIKRIIQSFFLTLGVIFFVLLLGLAYLWFADPFELKPLYYALTAPKSTNATSTPSDDLTSTPKAGNNPLLTPTQEKTLQMIGVDPSTLPTTITPQMETCFTQTLGQARMLEIKQGSAPTITDFMQAKSCL